MHFQLIFKKLYRNSGREIGTLRYFREKLQRRNVTLDVKHFEDCEQLFLSTGKCFTVEALLHFFNMETKDGCPTRNSPPYHILYGEDNRRHYYDSTLDKFIDEYLIPNPTNEEEPHSNIDEDHVRNYSLCILKYYFIMIDFKDAVKEGNGARLATLHKQFLQHFKSDFGFNAYAIEMLINIVQNEVFLSESEAHHCKWSSTANWKGGSAKNLEIDILQENRNKDIKKLIKGMGANKTDKAIERASRAAAGVRKIVENFDTQVSLSPASSTHSHKSSARDEAKILTDLRQVKPFSNQPGRSHDSFPNIRPDPLETMDAEELDRWLTRHKKNLLLHAPLGQEADD